MPKLPDELPWYEVDTPGKRARDLLQQRAQEQNFTGFMPDRGLFDAYIQAQIDAAMGRLPFNEEAFNANLASRGLFTAGEAPKYLYSDVYAPVASAIAQSTTQGNLQFAGMQQQGAIAAESAMSNRIGMYINWLLSQQQLELQRRQIAAEQSAAWGNVFGNLAGIGIQAWPLLK